MHPDITQDATDKMKLTVEMIKKLLGGPRNYGLTIEEKEEIKRQEEEARLKKEEEDRREKEKQEAEEAAERMRRQEEWVCIVCITELVSDID